MSPDLKQTLPCDEPQDTKQTALSTTLIQPIPGAQKSELTRTRYWEQRASDNPSVKRSAASYAANGNTRVGLGPDDPFVQAVEAVKLQLMQAPQARDIGTAMTMVLPAPEALQLLASRITARPQQNPSTTITHVDRDEPVIVPKRRTRTLAFAAAGLSLLLGLVSLYAWTDSNAAAKAGVLRPRPQTQAPAAPAQTPAAVPLPAAISSSIARDPTTSERAAVDALFAGDYAQAQRHYQALAQAFPNQPAFAEAARILSRKE